MYIGGEIAAPPALVRMHLCSSEYLKYCCNYLSKPLYILLRHPGYLCSVFCLFPLEAMCVTSAVVLTIIYCQFRPELSGLVA